MILLMMQIGQEIIKPGTLGSTYVHNVITNIYLLYVYL